MEVWGGIGLYSYIRDIFGCDHNCLPVETTRRVPEKGLSTMYQVQDIVCRVKHPSVSPTAREFLDVASYSFGCSGHNFLWYSCIDVCTYPHTASPVWPLTPVFRPSPQYYIVMLYALKLLRLHEKPAVVVVLFWCVDSRDSRVVWHQDLHGGTHSALHTSYFKVVRLILAWSPCPPNSASGGRD